MRAKETSDKINALEAIEGKLLSYNINTISNDSKVEAITVIGKLLEDEVIDSVLVKDGSFTDDLSELVAIPITTDDGSWNGEFEYVVGKGDNAFNIFHKADGTFEIENSDIIAGLDAIGGEVTGGKTLVTSETFKANDEEETNQNQKGIYEISGDASVLFANELEGEYSIYVKSGANATISVFGNMTLTNSGLQRSAIDIEPGGTLNGLQMELQLL